MMRSTQNVAVGLATLFARAHGDSIFAEKTNERVSNPLLPLLTCSLIVVLGMWGYQRLTAKKNLRISEKMKRLKNADKILIGILKNFSLNSVQDFHFRGIRQKVQTVSVEYRSLSVTLKGHREPSNGLKASADKTLLDGVSGTFHAGRMSAIMGPSGAGKTTFLNTLCGKLKSKGDWNVTGEVLVNGVEQEITDLKPVIGFVPQDDVVHETMTVRENIRFSAELRNPAGTSKNQLNKITDDVLQVLQLEAQQNTLVGNRVTGTGLSGGQRKRVNIGLELAACPTLLFLDEPTSGLDATSSLLLCEMLKKMTHLGMTVVMVIHQPRYSLFTLIDDVLLLGKGGRTAYVGATNGAKGYLEGLGFEMPANENPADWMMDILSGHAPIENPRLPSETLPEALFQEWERAAASSRPQLNRQMTIRGRAVTESDEREIIKRHVRDEWEKVCPDAATIDHKGLMRVLSNCLGYELTDEKIVEDLVLLVAGQAETPISQQQFVRYLLKYREVNKRGVDNDAVSLDDASSTSDESEDSGSDVESLTAERMQQDLNRTLPGCAQNFRVEVQRNLLTWWRRMPVRMCFLVVIEFSAVFLGFFDTVIFESPQWLPTVILNLHISIALLISVFSLTCFSLDQPIFWRESSHGLNRFAFMIARMTVDMLDWMALCFFYTATYYIITLPELRFEVYIVPFLLVSYVATGWGYLISCILPPVLAPFCAAVLSFMLGGILGLPDKMDRFLDGSYLEFIVDVACFTRWSVPMDFLAYVHRHPLNLTALDPKMQYQYDLYMKGYSKPQWQLGEEVASPWYTGLFALLVMGSVLRLACYPALRFMNASKQV